jgi:hypothetical protein
MLFPANMIADQRSQITIIVILPCKEIGGEIYLDLLSCNLIYNLKAKWKDFMVYRPQSTFCKKIKTDINCTYSSIFCLLNYKATGS